MNSISIKKYWLIASVIMLLGAAWIAWTALQMAPEDDKLMAQPQQNFSAPDFELTNLEGESVRLSQFKGRVVLLNGWASWCPPCRAEMPAIQRVYQEFAKDGLVVLAVNSTSQDDLAEARSFVERNWLDFPVLLDSDGSWVRLYHVISLPTSFFIAKDGVVRKVVVGEMPEALIRVEYP